MKSRAAIFWGLVALSLLLSIVLYADLPAKMASHWNARGETDGWMSRTTAAFLLPGIMAIVALAALVIPRIDSLSGNIEMFRKYFDLLMLLVLGFMFVAHLFVLLWNRGIRLDPNYVFPAGIAALFWYMGVLCGVAKRNWFIGIRTPWTLSSDRVWEKTHRRAKPLFKISALLVLGGVWLGEQAIYALLIPLIALIVYLVVYSYIEYGRETHLVP